MNILIIKLGALGDVINTLPLVVNLKTHIQARIHWLVEPLSYPIIYEHPYVDEALLFDKFRWATSLTEIVQQLRAKKFDIVIDLQRILKSGFFSMFANTKRRIGFDRKRCKEMSWIFPFERIPEADPRAHMVYQYLEFAKYLGIPEDDTNVRWELSITGKRFQGLPENYVVLNIGATKPANRWTSEGFASLVKAIKQIFHLPSVITGGVEDIEMAKKITAQTGGKVVDLVGKTSLKDLMEILHNSMIVISCDTGPMHLAVALGKEVIALFGPADPRRTGPFKGQVIQKNFACCPCNQKKCKDPICMEAITHKDVIKRLSGLLHV